MGFPDNVSRIRLLKWHGHHEVSQSKRVKGPLPWVAIPTRQGIGYCRLVERCGAAGLGVWVALVQLAASRSADKRGVIDGTIDDVSTMARLRSEDTRSTLGVLSDLGWIALETPNNGRAPSVVDDAPSTVDKSLPTDGRTDGRDGTDNPPNPPSRGGSPLRGFPDLVRRLLRGGRPPDGYTNWDAFFASRAPAHRNSAERACYAWLMAEGGEHAVSAAVERGKLPARYASEANA